MKDISEDLAKAEADTLREILRNAESYLAAQLTVVLASNQRAMAFASLLMGAFLVTAGSTVSLIINTGGNKFLAWVGIVVAFGLLAAMFMALQAGRPASFYYTGNSPAEWVGDVKTQKAFTQSLAEQAGHYAEMIESNTKTIARDNKWFQVSKWLTWTTLLLAVMAVYGFLKYNPRDLVSLSYSIRLVQPGETCPR